MNRWLPLAAVVLLWSTSSTVVVEFRDAISPLKAASLVVIVAAIGTILSLFIFQRRIIEEALHAKLTPNNLPHLALLAALAFVIYPICYFTGLHSGHPIAANVVNYTWPAIYLLVAVALGEERFTFERLAGVALSFLGAMVAVQGLNEAVPWFQNYTGPIGPALLASSSVAFLGALSYGSYSAGLRRLLLTDKDGRPLSSGATFLILLSFAAIMHVLLLVVSGAFFPDAVAPIGIRAKSALAVYALANLAAAHFLWLYAVRRVEAFESAIAVYITPVASTLILSLTLRHHFSVDLLASLSLIVAGIYLSRFRTTYVSPLTGAIIAALVSRAVLLLAPSIANLSSGEKSTVLSLLEVVIGVFAILSGFVLARAIELHQERERRLLRLAQRAIALEEASGNVEVAKKFFSLRVALIEEYAARCGLTDSESPSRVAATQSALRALGEDCGQVIGTRELGHIGEEVVEWRYLLNEAVSSYEWASLIILTLVATSGLLAIGDEGWQYAVGRDGVFVALILILSAIRDRDRGRVHRVGAFLLSIQVAAKTPFLPTAVAHQDDLHAAGGAVTVTTQAADGSLSDYLLPPVRPPLVRYFWPVLMTAMLATMFAALAFKVPTTGSP